METDDQYLIKMLNAIKEVQKNKYCSESEMDDDIKNIINKAYEDGLKDGHEEGLNDAKLKVFK